MIEVASRLLYLLDPVIWAEDTFGFVADPWQAKLLRSRSPQVIINCGRQTGKSSAVAILACHTAIHFDDELVILIAPSQRQSRELALKVMSLLKQIEPHEDLDEDNKLSITLARNRSRIVALPGHDPKTIRGFSRPRLIVEDEAAYVGDDTYSALLPMLAAAPEGRIALLSTPSLCQGHFYDIWHGSGSWERYQVPSADCPRVSAAWLEERKRENPLTYAREYECTFGAADDALFTEAMLDRMVTYDFEPLRL